MAHACVCNQVRLAAHLPGSAVHLPAFCECIPKTSSKPFCDTVSTTAASRLSVAIHVSCSHTDACASLAALVHARHVSMTAMHADITLIWPLVATCQQQPTGLPPATTSCHSKLQAQPAQCDFAAVTTSCCRLAPPLNTPATAAHCLLLGQQQLFAVPRLCWLSQCGRQQQQAATPASPNT